MSAWVRTARIHPGSDGAKLCEGKVVFVVLFVTSCYDVCMYVLMFVSCCYIISFMQFSCERAMCVFS